MIVAPAKSIIIRCFAFEKGLTTNDMSFAVRDFAPNRNQLQKVTPGVRKVLYIKAKVSHLL